MREGYRDMVNNMTLARRFGAHLAGARARARASATTRVGAGSTDMGDVSHVVPVDPPVAGDRRRRGEPLCHEHRFAEAAGSDAGAHTALVAAKALARTAIEFLADAELRAAVSAEWRAATGTRSSDGDVDPQARGVVHHELHQRPALGHLGQPLEAAVVHLEADARRRRATMRVTWAHPHRLRAAGCRAASR